MTAEEIIRLYRLLKEHKDEIEARHKLELTAVKKKLEMFEGKIDKFLTDHNLLNVKTAYGTAYISTKWSSALVDPDKFMAFVVESAKWELLDRKSNVNAVRTYVTEHKELPPGAKLNSRRVVHVLKAGGTIPDDNDE